MRVFEVRFNDNIMEDKDQQRLQRDIFIGIEEYLLYTGNLKEDLKPEDVMSHLGLVVREHKTRI